jgi:hypothetical protein
MGDEKSVPFPIPCSAAGDTTADYERNGCRNESAIRHSPIGSGRIFVFGEGGSAGYNGGMGVKGACDV